MDHERLCRNVVDEMKQIADKGLSTANIDIAYKLVDMYKDLKNVEYWERKGEYYDEVLDQMRSGEGGYSMGMDDEGYSMRRHRDSRGRYARDGGREDYDRGNSYRGGSYNDGHSMMRRGGYSRADGGDDYDRYMENKQAYRSGEKTADCKRRMLDAMEAHLGGLADEVLELARDADCAEEREALSRFADKIKKM